MEAWEGTRSGSKQVDANEPRTVAARFNTLGEDRPDIMAVAAPPSAEEKCSSMRTMICAQHAFDREESKSDGTGEPRMVQVESTTTPLVLLF